jgi:hypothetical protein
MECKKALKSGIIAVTLFVAAFLTTQQQQVQASDARNTEENRGLLGNFDQGVRDGRAAGASDQRNGYTYNSICPGSQFAEYCVGWGIGYNDGYRSAERIG